MHSFDRRHNSNQDSPRWSLSLLVLGVLLVAAVVLVGLSIHGRNYGFAILLGVLFAGLVVAELVHLRRGRG